MKLFKSKDISAYTDEQLVRAIGRGNTAAFDRLYEDYADRLYRYFLRMLSGDTEKARDFLQDLFLKVLHASHMFDAQYTLNTWLYGMATNMCRNEWRNTSNRQKLMKSFEPWEHHPKLVTESMDERLRYKVLNEIMNELDQEQKEILQLRFQQELTVREIAVITGLPEGTVKSKIFYLLKKMAQQMKVKQLNYE